MLNWKDYTNNETLNWLLEEDNPSVRYLTLIDILEKSENDLEVVLQCL